MLSDNKLEPAQARIEQNTHVFSGLLPLFLLFVPHYQLFFLLIDIPSLIFLQTTMDLYDLIMRTRGMYGQGALSLPLEFIHIDDWQFLSASFS